MHDDDTTLLRLRELADQGSRHARGVPPDEVRTRGQRRHRRRVAAIAVATSAVVAALAGGSYAALGLLTNPVEPQPAGPAPTVVQSPTASQAPSLERYLLRPDQTWFHEQGQLIETQTVEGEGSDELFVCQRDALASVGAAAVWRRDFTLPGAQNTGLKTAAVQFADSTDASRAHATISSWVQDCRTAESAGFEEASGGGDLGYEVPVDVGAARFFEYMFQPAPGDSSGELGLFEDTGLVLVEDKIMVVSLYGVGLDWNWSYDPSFTDLPMNPLFHMLPAAAANLAD
jgi:hypothetical protein